MSVPSHVPPELVVDVDLYAMPGGTAEPHRAWRAFLGKGPLVWSSRNGGHWMATCGADIVKFFNDPQRFSSRFGVALPDSGVDRMVPVEADPPEHTGYRMNIQGLFTPKAVEKLDAGIRELTISLIEGFRPKGGCEFVSDFALQVPLLVFLRIMGLPPEDRLLLREPVDTFIQNPDLEAKRLAHLQLEQYCNQWLDERIANPGDDAVTLITRMQIDGRPYTRKEMVATFKLLLHAGLDTVQNMMSFIVLHMARHPQDRRYIRENTQHMHKIIQELVRRFPGPNQSRVLTEDYIHKGVFLKKGDRIMIPASMYNFDPDRGADPYEVDFNREAQHVTFGSGRHTCAGALLARRELAIWLEEWAARIPDFTTDPEHPVEQNGGPQNTVIRLWLEWSP